jgi:hypothetical protein
MPTELDPAAKITAVVDGLVARFATIPPDAAGRPVTVYDHDIEAFKPPAIMVGVVDVERTGLREPETELGKDDWLLTIHGTAYVALQDRKNDQTAARRLVGQMIAAIDASPTLAGEVDEVKLVEARTGYNTEQANRRLIVIEFELEALAQLPDL